MKRVGALLAIIASVATVLSFLLSAQVRTILTKTVSLEVWQLLLGALCLFVLGLLMRFRARTVPATVASSVLLPRPRLMLAEQPHSLETVGVHVLQKEQGSISCWVYVHRNGEGLRALVNNRYIFSCATHVSSPYKNVLAIAHGPNVYNPPSNPSWKLWIANGSGNGHTWTYPDGGEFPPGWHLLVVRWDHASPILQLLLDGRNLIRKTGYLPLWPEDYPDRAWIGCWPNKSKIHYANTFLARFQLVSEYVRDDWIQAELARRPEDVAP